MAKQFPEQMLKYYQVDSKEQHQLNIHQNWKFYFGEIAFENDVCEMSAISYNTREQNNLGRRYFSIYLITPTKTVCDL